MAEEKIGLTVFLLKAEKVAALEKALLGPGKVIIPLRAPLSGVFLPFPANEENEPSWVQSVKSIIRAPIVGDMGNKSPAGMLLVKREEKNFAVTFGHA